MHSDRADPLLGGTAGFRMTFVTANLTGLFDLDTNCGNEHHHGQTMLLQSIACRTGRKMSVSTTVLGQARCCLSLVLMLQSQRHCLFSGAAGPVTSVGWHHMPQTADMCLQTTERRLQTAECKATLPGLLCSVNQNLPGVQRLLQNASLNHKVMLLCTNSPKHP